ncbi:pyrroloquinoline quinone biosynthesis peptide chaperone PqqD [Streptomyces sp. NPDC005374]|uniref:pyrroloquinoline quinone biosynthesis peptide chaperone PqqD n=1 Tax=Streptomyces sp. NPDC005374 TaxID=3364713 RepID=UPI0036926718
MSGAPTDWRPRVPRTAVLRHDHVRGGDVLLLPERVVVLHGSARAVLDLCDGSRTVDEIITLLGHAHESPKDAVRHDVTSFLDRLHTEGWLQ